MNAERKIKYTYVCEHCSHRNEKFYEIKDKAYKTTSKTKGADLITTTYSDEYLKEILTDSLDTPLGKIDNKHPRAHFTNFDSKCSNCKKRQSWSTLFFYIISFVFVIMPISLIAIAANEFFDEDTNIIILISSGVIFLFNIVVGLFGVERLIGIIAKKRVKDECSIPEIIEVGEIKFSKTLF